MQQAQGSLPSFIIEKRKVLTMICLHCGKAIDDDLKVCPFCGNLVDAPDDASAYHAEAPADPPDADYPSDDNVNDGQDYFDENPVYPEARKPRKPFSAPALSGMPALLLSALACVFSLACLIMLLSLRSNLREQNNVLTGSVSEVRNAVNAVNDRLYELDDTLSRVQSEAYNQLASQSIAIVKDITPLTGPVEADRYNRMFIINAKGNLSVNTSFDWQKYNESTGGWVSVVFTGDATTNEQYGLRLENSFDRTEDTYTTILWANGIKPEASGTYRCVITDATGITKTSAEATVTVN